MFCVLFYDKIESVNKLLFILPALLLSTPVLADSTILPEKNPFMGTYQQQIGFGLGQGLDTGWLIPAPVRPVPFYIGTFTYSQPTTFFRVPARQSLNISAAVGLGEKYGWQWQNYTVPIAYVTEDIALLRIKRFYAGMGAGAGLQSQQNERIGSKLLFQFKITFGYNITRQWATEFFMQHFSNANTADENNSYGFYGISFTYNY